MQFLLAILSVITLSQCGKQNAKSSKVEITITPNTPIVITGDVAGDVPRTAPWFEFSVSLANNSDSTFTLVAMSAEITLIDGSTTLEGQTTWAPSVNDKTYDTYSCAYTTYGTWAPTEDKAMYITNTTGASGCYSGPIGFIASSLPKPTNNPNNFRYRLKLKPLGYFVDDSGNANDRFEKFKLFFTK